MRITAGITQQNPVHTRLSVWVEGGLIVEPGGICLRNEEVAPFLERLQPDEIYDQRVFAEGDTATGGQADELGIPETYTKCRETHQLHWRKEPA